MEAPRSPEAGGKRRQKVGTKKNPFCYEEEKGIGWLNKKRPTSLLRVTISPGCDQLCLYSSAEMKEGQLSKDKTMAPQLEGSARRGMFLVCNNDADVMDDGNHESACDGKSNGCSSKCCLVVQESAPSVSYDLPCSIWNTWSGSNPKKPFVVFQFVAFQDAMEVARSCLFFVYQGKFIQPHGINIKHLGFKALSLLPPALVPDAVRGELADTRLSVFWSKSNAVSEKEEKTIERWVIILRFFRVVLTLGGKKTLSKRICASSNVLCPNLEILPTNMDGGFVRASLGRRGILMGGRRTVCWLCPTLTWCAIASIGSALLYILPFAHYSGRRY